MNDRILGLLGICLRAGKLTLGNDMVLSGAENGEVVLVVTAKDISKNTLKKILSCCERCGVRHIPLDRTKDEMSLALGRLCVVAGIRDVGFSKKISELAENNRR
ncbi:MAG: ribosomal L7Ae/L30e/S12e/Gadd45 family protein [Ruminococcus sp.]|nr:ribosomal L7Ae/L30e/S12e/Gadd45 family protein [Ruminococcus sp.]